MVGTYYDLVSEMNRARLKSVLNSVRNLVWVLFLVTLPFTSFPYLPKAMGGGVLVRPLSIYPLMILILLVTIPRLWRRPVPKTVLAFLPFIFVAIISGLFSLNRGVEPAYGIEISERVIRALITIGIGFAFFVTVALMPRTLKDLNQSLRWIYIGMAIALAWGSLQAVYVVHWNGNYYRMLNNFQQLISIRRLIENRVSAFTYEPNWFAEQISLLLFPWLLASILTGKTVFPWRWHWLTVEWFLLAWAVALLPLTYSRSGVLNLVAVAILCLFVFRFVGKEDRNGLLRARPPLTRRIFHRLVETVVVLFVVAGLLVAAGTRNEFFRRLWSYWLEKDNPNISSYLKYLGFGARFFYNEAAYSTYLEYPIFGVGPGNYAFYFDEMLAERPLALTPEVLRIITPQVDRARLITSKNFFLRLMAETGIVGTVAFMAFLIAVTGCALYLWLASDREAKFWGIAGLLGIAVFLLSTLSFDSFAFPNAWVVFGMVTAATTYFSRFSSGKITPEASLENQEKPKP